MNEEPPRKTAEEIETSLKQFFGCSESERTEAYPTMAMSQGVAWLCEETDCHWLMDCIYSYQTLPQVARESFQVIDIHVDIEKHTGRVDVGDGNENIIFTQKIPYTDFPLAKIRLYFANGVVYLPREH